LDTTTQLAEIEFLLKKTEGADHVPAKLREEIDISIKRIRRMARQGNISEEYEIVAKYIDWCMRVPWGVITQDNLDIPNVTEMMNSEHYGLTSVKESIIEYLAVLKKKQQMGIKDFRAPIICFAGPQGTGKTTMAKIIAKSLGRSFYRISLGALSAPTELRGMPKGTIDSEPGQIVKALAKCQSFSPVILLDELDKVSGEQGRLKDFMAILLEILDPQQNTTFRDQYIDYPLDLSKIFFICTANTLETITKALLDRLEVIQFVDYTPEEKMVIGRDYLLKHVLDYAGLKPDEFRISDDVWKVIVDKCGQNEGIRTLERMMERMARKSAKQIVTGQLSTVTVTLDNVGDYLVEAVRTAGNGENVQVNEQLNSQTHPNFNKNSNVGVNLSS